MAITEFPIFTKKFEELEPITDAQSTDSDGVMLYDDSVGVMKRMTKGELFKGKVIPIDDITGFLGIDYLQVSDRQQYHLNSFAPGGESGGGSLMWSATLPKILHDGVRYFSPTVPMPADFDNEQDVQDYKDGVGEEFPADLGIFVLTSFSIQSSEHPAVDGAIVLFDGISGNRVKNGPVPSEIGASLIESPPVEEVSYHRLNADETVTARNIVEHKTDLQLDNVDNTSDADKPISTATQTALNLKANSADVADDLALVADDLALKAPLSSPDLTGNPTAPTPAADDDSESIATTEYVQGELSDRIQSVATIADLANLSLTVGARANTNGALIAGKGAADYLVQAPVGSPDGFSRVLLANGNHAVLLTKNNTVTPEQFGVIGDGTTSDAAAFVRMANFIKSSGGGRAKGTPGQTYLLADTSSIPGALIDLGAIPHFSMDFCGATIKGTNTLAQGNINLFTATNGKNITIKNAVCDFPLIEDEAEDPYGVSLFVGYDKCENVKISGLSGYGGFNSIMAFERSNTGAFLPYHSQASGISLKDVDLEAVGYGINCRFNGSFLRARSVKFGYCHRAYYPYGVTNHDVEVELDDYNATGCLLSGVSGRTLRNIKLKVRVEKTQGILRGATSAVSFAFSGSTASAIRNVQVEIDADMNSLHGIGVSFDITGAPAVGRHALYDIGIKANIRNPSNRAVTYREFSGGSFASHVSCDFMKFGGTCTNMGSGSLLPNFNSTSRAVVKELNLIGTSAALEVAGTTTRSVLFDGCQAGMLFSSMRSDYVDSIISDSTGIEPHLCTFKNTTIGSILVNKSLMRHVMPPNENTIQPDLIAARLVVQSAASTLSITLANGTHIYADQLPSVGVSGCVYDFAIGVAGTSSSTVGVYTGRVMLKASGGVITAISLIDVSVAHSSGSALTPADLAVSLNSGSPVFALTSSLTNYTQGQVVIRDI